MSVTAPIDAAGAGSLQACGLVARREARNFYWGLRLTPEPRRGALYAVYAWTRRADDLADDDSGTQSVAERRAALASFSARTGAMLHGDRVTAPPEEVFWPALRWTVETFALETSWLMDLLAGLEEDIDHAGYETHEELARYRYRVAGTVGLMCTAIWGPRRDGPAALELARRRGLAFQMINIVRDIAPDAGMRPRRVYIPRRTLAVHGVDVEGVLAWRDAKACEGVVRELCQVARDDLRASMGLEMMLERSCARSLWLMTSIYAGILERIEAEPSLAVRTPPCRVPTVGKLGLAVRAMLGTPWSTS